MDVARPYWWRGYLLSSQLFPEATPGGYGAARASTECPAGGANSAEFRLPVTLGGRYPRFPRSGGTEHAAALVHAGHCYGHSSRGIPGTLITPPPEATPGGYAAARASTEC